MAFSAIRCNAPELPDPSFATSYSFLTSILSSSAALSVSITKVVVPSDRKLLINFAFAPFPTAPK